MAVAQLVESRIVIPVVVGSSPISHPKFKDLRRFQSPGVKIVRDAVLDAASRGYDKQGSQLKWQCVVLFAY